ncbi:MAG TPA: TolC family protein [Candidatus Melainabacteria bacterium]|nr:TolC family protein [Candidatus Melainabacteria bacterium]HIN64996.1 TolC family protein [Candidatus Obscuribacterales bacterium]
MEGKTMYLTCRVKRLMAVSLAAYVVSCPSAHTASATPSILNIPKADSPSSVQDLTTLTGAFDESLLNSPRAAHLRAQLGISKAAFAQALTLPNPSFFFLEDTAQRARQIGASVPIEGPWKIAFRLLLAKQQVRLADLEIQNNLWQLRATVRRAYLDVVMAKETVETLDTLMTLSKELEKTARKRFEADDVAAYDVERASLAGMQAEADYRQSLKRLEQSRQRLTVIMGKDYRKPVDVNHLPTFQLRAANDEMLPDFSKELPSLDSLVADGLKNRIDLKAVEQRMVVNTASMRNTVGNIIPNTQLNIGSSYSGNPPEGPPTKGMFVGVTQEVPVFNFQQGDIARLKATYIQFKREAASMKNVISEEVIAAYQQLSAARERLQLFQEKILPTSERVANMAKRGYEFGQNDITSTIAAQQANVQTRVNYLDAVRTYQQSLTDLEQAIGHPL